MTRTKLSDCHLGKPLTLIAHQDDIEVVNDVPNYMDITPEMTLAMAARFTPESWAKAKQDEDFKRRLTVMFPDLDIMTDPRELADYPIAIRHVVGLIVCTNMAINTLRQPLWRYPETYCHPATQVRFANLALTYINDAKAASA